MRIVEGECRPFPPPYCEFLLVLSNPHSFWKELIDLNRVCFAGPVSHHLPVLLGNSDR